MRIVPLMSESCVAIIVITRSSIGLIPVGFYKIRGTIIFRARYNAIAMITGLRVY